MRRKAILLLMVIWLMTGIAVTPTSRARPVPAPILKSVMLAARVIGTELIWRVNGTYYYRSVQAGRDTVLIDLAGAKVDAATRDRQWVIPRFSEYKLKPYEDASGRSGARAELDAKQVQPVVPQKDGSNLLLSAKSLPANAAAAAAPVAPLEGAVAQLASSIAPVRVSTVSFDRHQSGETLVTVATSRKARYRTISLSNPARLAVDIDDALISSALETYPADTAVLRNVRVGQFRAHDPSVVRVVAELDGNPVVHVRAVPGGIGIDVRPRLTLNPEVLASQVSIPQANSEPLASQVTVPQANPEVSRTVVTAGIAPVPAASSEVASPVATKGVNVNKTDVTPPLLEETPDTLRSDVLSTLPTVNSPDLEAAALRRSSPGRVTPEALRARHAAEILLAEKDDSLMVAQAPPPANPTPPPPEESKPVYTGEPISLNLKDVDLKDFFRLIHEISGLNIILDPNVSGSVTLVLDSVPWDQALDIVLKNERLGKSLEGNVLRIARIETLTAEQEGQTKLASARMDAAPLVTVFRPINYAKAAEIAIILKTWAGGGALSRRGTVQVDTRGNTLIISDVQAQIPNIMDIVSKMDKKAKQVSIEARVVLASADFTRTLSASLIGGFANKSTVTTGATGSNSAITIPAPTAAQPFPLTTVTNATASGFGVASIVNVGANYFINAAISAAEERDQAKTISRPSIVTQNNVQGMVQQGLQVPIQTTINNTISVSYYAATLQLTVTPQVTDDNHIFLIINVQNNSVGASISGVGPEIATQQATTSVLVPDGGTVVFGGITVTSRSKSATYIPLLGSIPLVGHLFKTSNAADQDQELLFFVSPKVLVT